MAETKRQKPIWYVVGCVGLLILCVPCVGVLAAIAIPAFVSYGRRAKVAEAHANIAAITSGIRAYCDAERFPPTEPLPPAVGPSLTHPDATRQAQDFDAATWQAIGFGPSEPLYYSYAIERPDGSTALVIAEGDLDGDGTRSRFVSTCTTSGGLGCTCSPVVVTDELE